MIVVQDTDLETVKTIFKNKQLFDACLPDEDRVQREVGTWEPDPNGVWDFLEICLNDKVIGIVRYQPLSIVAVDIHPAVLPEYWGTNMTEKFMPKVEEYFKCNTKYHKLQIQCPQCCKHTIRAAARIGFEIEGVLIGATYWNEKIENLVMMGKFIGRK